MIVSQALMAGFWGLVAGSALVLGAILGLYLPIRQRIIGLIMAGGAGVLIAAVAFSLMGDAYRRGGLRASAIGILLGSLVFFVADLLVSRFGGGKRKRSQGQQESGAGIVLAIGSLLDDIPESLAIGLTLLSGGSVGIPVLVAVFLSNVPEGLSSASGMRKSGYSARYIVGMWLAVMLACGLSAWLGNFLLAGAPGLLVGSTQSFAAGAILAMLASTMMPEAYENSGPLVGLVTALSFLVAFVLGKLS